MDTISDENTWPQMDHRIRSDTVHDPIKLFLGGTIEDLSSLIRRILSARCYPDMK
jgi:hypothetical protein